MKAIIITIGDELLMGQVVDTNSQYIARRLTHLGIEIQSIRSIQDDRDEIWNTVDSALQEVDLVMVTGGLGPTNDDITKSVLAKYFNTKLSLNEQALGWIEELLSGRSVPMNELNRSQAMLPENCELLRNYKGTAAGMWFRKGWKSLISLPGVPFEMEHLLDEYVIPKLKKENPKVVLDYRMVKVYGIPESELAIRLADFEKTLYDGMKLAYLPSAGYVRLRLTATGMTLKSLDERYVALKTLLEGLRFVEGETEGLENELKTWLNGRTVATAESCTGGNIAHLITSVSGSSSYFQGSVVAYQNSVKESVLGVGKDVLEQNGAVSEPVVKAMAEGIRKVMNADYGIATSGIAGPTGGTVDKPVGTVWIAIATPQHTVAKCYHFSYTRERNIAKASVAALEMLILELTGK
ncbi:MAG: CinA family nicotinamide mononucleotide deamidase-related protein [Marinifilaceae bacterium]